MKKQLQGFLVGVLITCTVLFSIPAFASGISKSINATLNSVKIVLNGKAVSVDNLSYNGSTYVNLSKICELTGKTTKWDSKTKTVSIEDKKAEDSKANPETSQTNKQEVNKPEQKEPAVVNPPSADNNSPKLAITSVNTLSGAASVEIVFNKVVDKSSAENISNYLITLAYGNKSGVSISSATLDSTGTKVTLKATADDVKTLYNLTVSNIKDTSGNSIDNYSAKVIMGSKEPQYPKSASIAVQQKSNNTIELNFSVNLDKKSAEDVSNYIMKEAYQSQTALTIIKAELGSENNKILLTFSEPKFEVPYKILVKNIKDESGNNLLCDDSSLILKKL